jgi:hypothetical protein
VVDYYGLRQELHVLSDLKKSKKQLVSLIVSISLLSYLYDLHVRKKCVHLDIKGANIFTRKNNDGRITTDSESMIPISSESTEKYLPLIYDSKYELKKEMSGE